MGQRYLIDTNVMIDFQTGLIPADSLQYLIGVINDSFTISVVTYIEFLGYANVSQTMEDFIALAGVIKLEDAIIVQTIAIRKSYKIKLPDAIIAATAMTNDFTLISRNIKDFERIDGLKVINPYLL